MTLATDPGPGFDEDTRVELIAPRINSYQIDSPDGRSISGLAFKALGLKPAARAAPGGDARAQHRRPVAYNRRCPVRL